MEITSKQRAKLRSLAQTEDTIAQFGKDELTDAQVAMIDNALKKRELIKCSCLETSPYTAEELMQILAEKTNSLPVTAIGRKFVLYKRNNKKPIIKLD